MNKYKKIAAVAVSAVMAGTMLGTLTACNPGNDEYEEFDPTNLVVVKADGSIDYSAYQREKDVTLKIAIGHNSKTVSTSFLDIGDQVTLPDGKTYSQGDMKPAWQAMGDDLDITWEDRYEGDSTSANLGNLLKTDSSGRPKYDNVDLFTSDLSKVVENVSKGAADVLNLANYLDYMPHFKAFLENNPVVYLSLLQDGMNTTTGAGQELYVAPYFDGYNDIERYCLMRQDWVEKLLNGDTAPAQDGTKLGKAVKAQAFMGKTAADNLTIDSLNEDGTAKIKIVKNYGNVLTEIGKSGSALKTAYDAIVPAGYTGTSGNIVDIMNAAITANANATGKQLVVLFRAYIDACYRTENNEQYYSADKRANLFNGYDACWDADDMTAMLRCVMTNAANLGVKNIGGITARSEDRDRVDDLKKLAGQLYGVRGTASTLEYTYIDNNGDLKDARTDVEFYEALEKMNALFEEGLIMDYTTEKYSATGGLTGKKVNETDTQCFMLYDYSQTQTQNNFYVEDSLSDGPDIARDYKFGAVMTPVSKWDVDGNKDNGHETVMRFTESWRSTKTSGLAVNGEMAKKGGKLRAALQFIDYLYSEDGQIVSTFGPRANNADGDGGFWYDAEATAAQVTAGEYYTFKGVKYHGTEYKGKSTPTATQKLQDSFRGKKVNEWKLSDNSKVNKPLSYTDYARMLLGATLPVGVKNQSLENQLTSEAGKAGANKVATALSEQFQTVKGMSLEIDADNYWYTCVPTGLPVSPDDQTQILDATIASNFKTIFGGISDKKYVTIDGAIIRYGVSQNYSQKDITINFASISALLDHKLGADDNTKILKIAQDRQAAYNRAWTTAKNYWTYLSSKISNN